MGQMPIGEYARLARLTVKAVRHYDAEGLLVPASVDPHSGYRYYRVEQVRTATTIALLRSLDVPLPVVREVLAAPDGAAVAAVLAAQRERLAAELARREQVLRSLDVLLQAPEHARYDVAVADRATSSTWRSACPPQAGTHHCPVGRGPRRCTSARMRSCRWPTRHCWITCASTATARRAR
jgi:DNA-binding transcriptional MerR regulator